MQCLPRYQYADPINGGKEAPVPAWFARTCRESKWGHYDLTIGLALFSMMHEYVASGVDCITKTSEDFPSTLCSPARQYLEGPSPTTQSPEFHLADDRGYMLGRNYIAASRLNFQHYFGKAVWLIVWSVDIRQRGRWLRYRYIIPKATRKMAAFKCHVEDIEHLRSCAGGDDRHL